jgi:hypothetical protein
MSHTLLGYEIINSDKMNLSYTWNGISKLERIANKIMPEPNTGCWFWMGVLNKGYGMTSLPGKVCSAHRMIYKLLIGKIPKYIFACHSCDNPSCVNPFHVFLGTQSDNMTDMKLKGRSLSGELNGFSRFNTKQILRIRNLYEIGYRQKRIAKIFKTSQGCISNIITKRAWKHI